jgi:hypothetical protein
MFCVLIIAYTWIISQWSVFNEVSEAVPGVRLCLMVMLVTFTSMTIIRFVCAFTYDRRLDSLRFCILIIHSIVEYICAAFGWNLINSPEFILESKDKQKVVFIKVFELIIWLPICGIVFLFMLLLFLICLMTYHAYGVRENERQRLRHIPFVQDYIDRLSRNPTAEEATGQCAICFDKFQTNDDVAELTCSGRHIFHVSCLKRWVQERTVCPMCREEIGL